MREEQNQKVWADVRKESLSCLETFDAYRACFWCGSCFNILERKQLSSHPRVGSELSPLAVRKWKKLKTHITKYFAKINRICSRPWIWAPSWSGLWPENPHTALVTGFSSSRMLCNMISCDSSGPSNCNISVPFSGKARAGDSSSHWVKSSGLCLLSRAHHCSARYKLSL